MRDELNDEDIAAFEPSEKIGIVATLTESGEPHATILSTIMARGERELVLGEFSRGKSKANLAARKKAGFLVMSLDRRVWRGKATWQRLAKDGDEYIKYNRQPMFRYNTYFGVNTVHYLALEGIEGPEPLPMGAIVRGSLATMLKARAARPLGGERIMPPFALGLIDRLASLNFLVHVAKDGFPRIIPVVQARSAGPSRIVFTRSAYRDELGALAEGTRTAILSMNLDMESFLARGALAKIGKGGLLGVDLDYLYNSAPPCHGQVYPAPRTEAMTESR